MKTSKVILSLVSGILTGAAAGAVMGILYAPDKGTETRRKLSQKGEEFKDNLVHKGEELRDNLKNKFENVKGDASELLEKGKSKIYEAKNDMNNSF